MRSTRLFIKITVEGKYKNNSKRKRKLNSQVNISKRNEAENENSFKNV